MASDRQKHFNRHMNDYLKNLPSDRHDHLKGHRIRRKSRPVKVEELEEVELEEAEEQLMRKGFFEKIADLFFGTRVVVETDQEKIDEEPITETKPGYLDSVKRVLFGEKENYEEADEQPIVKKVVIYKAKAEADLKKVVVFTDFLLARMNSIDKGKVMRMQEYREYREVKNKYSK